VPMVLISLKLGTFSIWTSFGHNKDAAIIGRAAFFEPEIVNSPFRE